MSSNRQNLQKLLIFYSLTLWFTQVSRSILPAHIYSQGVTINELLFGRVFQFIGQLAILLTITRLSFRKNWTSSLIFSAFLVLLLIKVNSVWQYYLSMIFGGFYLALFFVPYNIAHFRSTPKTKTGISSGLMFAIGPIIAIVSPLTAGYLATINLNYLWLITGVSFIVAIVAVKYQQESVFRYNIQKSLAYIRPTRLLIFLEGIWEAIVLSFTPIYTLFFFSTPLSYGKYLAYLAVLGTLAGLFVGWFTDRIKKRSVLLYPITILLSLFTALLIPAINNLTLWVVINGLIQLVLPIFWNITTALVVDQHPKLEVAMPAREIVLGVGRLLGVTLTLLGFYLNQIQPTIIFLALIIILFPLILFYRTKIAKTHSYF